MRMGAIRRVTLAALVAVGTVFGVVRPAQSDDFEAWILSRDQFTTLGHASREPLPVGSLQKPFLVRAWAASHPGERTPHFTCTRTSGCWRPSGHGALDLRGAIRESCNTYFKLLARQTSQEAMRDSFRAAGFLWKGDMTDAETIGLPGTAMVSIDPARLVESYVDLARTPWPTRDDVRAELLSGLRDSASDGTAAGLRLWGFLAKTGTVPALDGAPLKTSGFAIVLDDAGFAFLGLLRRGTGREAATRAGAEIARLRPGSATRPPSTASPKSNSPRSVDVKKRDADDPVRVLMLDELRLKKITMTNAGPGPVDSSRGFVGPNAMIDVRSGDRFSNGDWKIQASKPAFQRRIRGSIEAAEANGFLRLIASMKARDYADGVLRAELMPQTTGLRAPLASAVMRFLSHGPRHGLADVCDSTHCAWFVGEGPVPRWLRPDAPVNDSTMSADLTDGEWRDARAGLRLDPGGPDQWSADCGGDPVSPHFIWGNGDKHVTECPRHPRGLGKVWRREWQTADLAAVFGEVPGSIDVGVVDGQWMLKTRLPARPGASAKTIGLTYDQAHRRFAQRMGWDSMPAPATRVSRSASGFVAEGVGFGHRVGLCLAP